jgi:hypothetical protein
MPRPQKVAWRESLSKIESFSPENQIAFLPPIPTFSENDHSKLRAHESPKFPENQTSASLSIALFDNQNVCHFRDYESISCASFPSTAQRSSSQILLPEGQGSSLRPQNRKWREGLEISSQNGEWRRPGANHLRYRVAFEWAMSRGHGSSGNRDPMTRHRNGRQWRFASDMNSFI